MLNTSTAAGHATSRHSIGGVSMHQSARSQTKSGGTIQSGQSFPLGATLVDGGVNFSIYSNSCQRLELLFLDQPEESSVRVSPHLFLADPNKRSAVALEFVVHYPGVAKQNVEGPVTRES